MEGNEDYIDRTYKALKENLQGFAKTPEDFRKAVTEDPAYRVKVHKALSENLDGFTATPERFDSLVGVKKKENSESPLQDGGAFTDSSNPYPVTPKNFGQATPPSPQPKAGSPDQAGVLNPVQTEAAPEPNYFTKIAQGAAKSFTGAVSDWAKKLDHVQTLVENIISQPITDPKVKAVSEDRPLVTRPFKAVSEGIDWANKNAADVPEGFIGNVVKGVSGIIPEVAMASLMPQVAVEGWASKYGITHVNDFAMLLGAKGALTGSQESQGKDPLTQIIEPIKQAGKGFGEGLLYAGVGVTSEKIAKSVTEKIFGKSTAEGLLGGKTVALVSETPRETMNRAATEGISSVTSGALLFGGYTALEDAIRNIEKYGVVEGVKKIDWDNVAVSTGVGIGLGIRPLFRGIMSFASTPKETINKVAQSTTSPEEMKAMSDESLGKLNESVGRIKQEPVNQKELDNNILQAQQRLGLPNTPEVQFSPDTQTTLDNLSKGLPVTNEMLGAASTELYGIHKGLEGVRESSTRKLTSDQIQKPLTAIGSIIETLESAKTIQAENEAFLQAQDQFIVSATVNDNLAALKAFTEHVVSNPEEAKQMVSESSLPDAAKQDLVTKITEVAHENSPETLATKPITEQIDNLDSELKTVETSGDHPAVKAVKTKAIKEKRKVLDEELAKVVAPELVKEEVSKEKPAKVEEPVKKEPIDNIAYQDELVGKVAEGDRGLIDGMKKVIETGEDYNQFSAKEILAPIDVIKQPDGSYKTTDGNHRLVAYRELGIKDIPINDITPTEAAKPSEVSTKVVDEKGEPLVVYQGRSKKGLKSLFNNGEGWFSSHKRIAVQFADAEKHLKLYDTPEKYETIKNEELKGEVYPATLDIKNPMYVDIKETLWDRDKERAKIKEAKDKGHDGIIVTDEGKIRDAVVFDESQIKRIKPQSEGSSSEVSTINTETNAKTKGETQAGEKANEVGREEVLNAPAQGENTAGEVVAEPAVKPTDKLFQFYVDEPANRGNYTPEFNTEFDKRATKLDKVIKQKEEIEQGQGNTGKNPAADKRKLAELTTKYNTQVKDLMKFADENAPKNKVEPEVPKEEVKPPIKSREWQKAPSDHIQSAIDRLKAMKEEYKANRPLTGKTDAAGMTEEDIYMHALDVAMGILETSRDISKAIEVGIATMTGLPQEDKDRFRMEMEAFREGTAAPDKGKTMEGTGETRDKSVLNRMMAADNISAATKKGLERKGLTYEAQTHEEAREMAQQVIEGVGIDDGVLMAEAGKFGGAVNSLVFAEALDRLDAKSEAAKTPEETAKYAAQWADISIRYDIAGRESGRFSSAIQDYYKKSPLGMVVKENVARDRQFKDWSKNKQGSFDEVFAEITASPEGKSLLKDKFDELRKQERKDSRESKRQKISDIFDSAKISDDNVSLLNKYTKQNGLLSAQNINDAIEIMKKAVLAGESVANAVSQGVKAISDKVGEEWNQKVFVAEWEGKLADLDKGAKKGTTAEEKALSRIDALEKAIDKYKKDSASGNFKFREKKEVTDARIKKLTEERDAERKNYVKLRDQSAEGQARKDEQYLDRLKKKLTGMTAEQQNQVITRAMKSILDKGGLEKQEFQDMIAEAIGLGKMTPEQSSKMKDLVKKINAVDEAKKNVLENPSHANVTNFKNAVNDSELAARELSTMIHRTAKPGDMLWNIVKLNTLGAVSLLRNITYNVAYQPFVNFPKSALLTAYDYSLYGATSLLGMATGKSPIKPRNNVFKAQGGFIKGGYTGLKRSLYQFRTGLQDMDYFSNESFVSQIRPARAFKELWDFGKYKITGQGEPIFMKAPQIIEKLMQTTAGWNAEFIARSLNVGDKPFRFGVERSTANQIASTEFGLKKGLDRDMFHLFPKEEAYRLYKKQGLSDVAAMEKAEYVQKRIVQAGERAVMQNDNFVAKKIGQLETFLDSKENKGDPMWKLGDQIVRAMRTLNMPFVKIPLNVAWNLYNLANPMMAVTQSAFYASKSGYHYAKGDKIAGQKNSDISKDWAAHAMVGMALNAGVTYLIAQGLLNERGDDEGKRQSSGESFYSKSNSLNISGLKRLVMGGDPKLQHGDVLVDLSWLGIIGNLMNTNANTIAEKNKKKESGEEMNLIDEFASKMKHSSIEVLQNGVFSGSTKMIDALQKGGGYLDSWGLGMINLGTNFLEPATYAQWSRAMLPEKSSYKAESFWAEMKENQKQRDIVLRQFAGMPKSVVSMWGDPIPREKGFKAVAFAMLGFQEQDVNKFGAILFDDFMRTKDPKFFPPTVPNQVTIEGEKVKLTADEHRELETLVGQFRKNKVAPFIYDMATKYDEKQGPKAPKKYYSKYTDKGKVEELNLMYKEGYEDGLEIFARKYPKYSQAEEIPKPEPEPEPEPEPKKE